MYCGPNASLAVRRELFGGVYSLMGHDFHLQNLLLSTVWGNMKFDVFPPTLTMVGKRDEKADGETCT